MLGIPVLHRLVLIVEVAYEHARFGARKVLESVADMPKNVWSKFRVFSLSRKPPFVYMLPGR